MRKNTLGFAALIVCSAISFNASAEFLDFVGWDHSQIANGGQTFTDICGDLDVTVRSTGAFDADSTFVTTMTGGDRAIRSQQAGIGSHSFVFSFSQPIDTYVEFTRLDTEELLGVYGVGPEVYTHAAGLAPATSVDGSGLRLSGNGFGADAAGGRVAVGPTSVLTVSYSSVIDGPTKFLDFNIGKTAVPEPGSMSLLGLGILVVLQFARRSRC